MHRQVGLMAVAFAVLAAACVGGAYYTTAFIQALLLALFGAFLSVAIGLTIVNIVVDKKSRKIAAGPLLRLIAEPAQYYHNDLRVEAGRQHFGIAEYNRLMQLYNDSGGNPQVFSPTERSSLSALIDTQLNDVLECINDLDSKLSDLVAVLGWSYDARIIAAALTCKRNISGFKSVSHPKNDEETLRRLECYLDIDGSASAVVMEFRKNYEQPVLLERRTSSG